MPLKWFSDETNHAAVLKSLDETCRLPTREGKCYHHVQAILVGIDQYAVAANGNREYFLNKPHSIGRSRKIGDVLPCGPKSGAGAARSTCAGPAQ
jgi:hypothetical protein